VVISGHCVVRVKSLFCAEWQVLPQNDFPLLRGVMEQINRNVFYSEQLHNYRQVNT